MSTPPHSIGFPRMMKEPAEKRVFLPEFIQHLANAGLNVFIEEGYGSRSGFSFDDYRGSRSTTIARATNGYDAVRARRPFGKTSSLCCARRRWTSTRSSRPARP